MLSSRADKASAPRHHTSELPPATYPRRQGAGAEQSPVILGDQTASPEPESKDSWMIYVSLCLLGLFELREDGYEGKLKDDH